MARKAAEYVIKATDKTGRGTKSAKKNFFDLDKAAGDLRGSLLGASAAIALVGAGRATHNLAKTAAVAQDVARAFDSVATSAGMNSTRALADMRRATAGTIDDLTLMQKYNEAAALGVPMEEFADALEIARVAARNTGQTVDFMVSSIVTGLARQSVRIIDNLGITLSLSEATSEYAKHLGKTVNTLTDAEKSKAFMFLAMRKGRENVAAAGGAAEGAGDKFAQLQADAKNLGVAVGSWLLEPVGDLVGFFSDTASGIDDWMRSLSSSTAEKALAVLEGTGVALSEINFYRDMVTLDNTVRAIGDLSGAGVRNFDDLAKAISFHNEKVGEATNLNRSMGTSFTDYAMGEGRALDMVKRGARMVAEFNREWAQNEALMNSTAEAFESVDVDIRTLWASMNRLATVKDPLNTDNLKTAERLIENVSEAQARLAMGFFDESVTEKEYENLQGFLSQYAAALERIRETLTSKKAAEDIIENIDRRISSAEPPRLQVIVEPSGDMEFPAPPPMPPDWTSSVTPNEDEIERLRKFSAFLDSDPWRASADLRASIATEQERLNAAQARYSELLEYGFITQGEYDRGLEKLRESMETVTAQQQVMGQVIDTAWTSALDGPEEMGQALASLGLQLAGAAVKKIILDKMVSTAGASVKAAEATAGYHAAYAAIPFAGPALIAANVGKMYADIAASKGIAAGITAAAEGGYVSAGPVLVGERGPEILNLRTPGQVTPNHAITGTGGGLQLVVQVQGDLIADDTTKDNFARDMATRIQNLGVL